MDAKAEERSAPTTETYSDMIYAYDYFNRALFDGELPSCLFTYQRNKRVMGYVSKSRWINSENKYIDELALNPEYFAGWPIQEVLSTLAHEMVHIWQLNDEKGKPGRRGYHNKQFAKKMKEIGLQTSHTGKPGGKETGEQMNDYILSDGRFIQACNELIQEGFKLTWLDRYSLSRAPYPLRIYDENGVSITSEMTTINVDGSDVEVSDVATALLAGISSGALTFSGEGGEDKSPLKPVEKKNTRKKYVCSGCDIKAWAKPELFLVCGECGVKLDEYEA